MERSEGERRKSYRGEEGKRKGENRRRENGARNGLLPDV